MLHLGHVSVLLFDGRRPIFSRVIVLSLPNISSSHFSVTFLHLRDSIAMQNNYICCGNNSSNNLLLTEYIYAAGEGNVGAVKMSAISVANQ